MLCHKTLDGTTVAHGLLSTTLQDFARIGLLFTPSWSVTAHTPVVSDTVLKRLQTGGNKKEAFVNSTKYPALCDDFGEPPMTTSFQFDAVFEDGVVFGSTVISVKDSTLILDVIVWVYTFPRMDIFHLTEKIRCVATFVVLPSTVLVNKKNRMRIRSVY